MFRYVAEGLDKSLAEHEGGEAVQHELKRMSMVSRAKDALEHELHAMEDLDV